MNIEFTVIDWKPVLQNLAPVAMKNKSGEPWSHILIDTKKQLITASSPSKTIMSKAKMKSDLEGEVLIEATRLNALVSAMDNDTVLKLSINDGQATLIKGRNKYKLGTDDAAKYARYDKPTSMSQVMLDSIQLSKAINKTIDFTATQSEPRLQLRGVYIELGKEQIKLTATNSHYLSHVNFLHGGVKSSDDSPQERGVIVTPDFLRSALQLTKETSKVMLYLADSKICAASPTQMIWSSLIDAKYPNYAVLLEQSNRRSVDVDIVSWQSSIQRIKPLIDSKTKGKAVGVSSEDSLMKLTIANELGVSEEVVESVPLELNFELHLCVDYLDNVLKTNEQGVTVWLPQDGNGSILFKDTRNNLNSVQIIMPVRA